MVTNLNYTQFALLLLIWFELTAFTVMDGVDFGTGIASIFNRDNGFKDELMRSQGTVWSGREAWMVVAFALMFAAFPGWYSALFSGFYPIFIILLISFAMRGVAFEYIGQYKHEQMNIFWRILFFIGNLVPPFILGVLFSLLNSGLPIGSDQLLQFKFTTILHPLALMTGFMFVLFAVQIGLIREKSFIDSKYHALVDKFNDRMSTITLLAFIIELILYLTMGQGIRLHPLVTVILVAIPLIALIIVRIHPKYDKSNYVLMLIGFSSFVISFFWTIFPNVMMSNKGYNLTAKNIASGRESQIWVLWLFAFMIISIVVIQILVHYQFKHKYNMKDNQINY